MAVNVGGRSMPIAAVVGAVGGLLAAVGSVLAWESVGGEVAKFADSVSGIEGNGGKLCLVLGIAAIAIAGAWALKVQVPQPAVLLLVVGLLILGIAVLNFFNIKDDVDKVNAFIKDGASIGIGLMIVLAGAIVTVIGGALGLTKKG